MNEREALKLALEALETGGWNKTTAAITAIKEALALSESSTKCEETSHAQPEHETQAYREAARLAEWLFKTHYSQEEHYTSGRVVWGLCDTTVGVISQIDNMICKLVLPKEPEQEHVEQLARLGWQYFECPACGSEGAKAFQVGSPIYVAEVTMPDPDDSPGYTEYEPEHEFVLGECVKCGASIERQEPVPASDTSKERVDETAKQRHEPVAWRFPSGTWFSREVHWRYIDTLEGAEGLLGLQPLYTTPQPQREWVGLTDEEVSEVLGSDIHDEPSGELDFIRAIEAKLKEKNT